jgi:hypothetical protein
MRNAECGLRALVGLWFVVFGSWNFSFGIYFFVICVFLLIAKSSSLPATPLHTGTTEDALDYGIGESHFSRPDGRVDAADV